MTTTPWNAQDLLSHFFVHIEKVGVNDLLWPLNSPDRPAFAIVEEAVKVFEANLLQTSRATSTPFYVAMLAAQSEKTRIVADLFERGRAGDTTSLVNAAQILDGGAASVTDSPIEAFRTLKDKSILLNSFAALWAESTVMVWGTFETLLFDCSAELFSRKPTLLSSLSISGQKIWGRNPTTVATNLQALCAASPMTPPSSLFKTLSFQTVQLARLKPITTLLDSSGTLGTKTDNATLRTLEGQRHLLVHKGGVVDQRYLDATGETAAMGSQLIITPQTLEAYFRAVASAGLSFAEAVEKAV